MNGWQGARENAFRSGRRTGDLMVHTTVQYNDVPARILSYLFPFPVATCRWVVTRRSLTRVAKVGVAC